MAECSEDGNCDEFTLYGECDHQPKCLQEGPDCKGKVEWHLNPDRDDFKAFARCDYHQQIRLKESERTRELLSDCEPAWFDEANIGEHWGEDY